MLRPCGTSSVSARTSAERQARDGASSAAPGADGLHPSPAARRRLRAARAEATGLGPRVLCSSASAVAAVGSRGVFVKELEEALLERRIDVAVHSAKDLTATDPEGLVIAAYLRREDPRD